MSDTRLGGFLVAITSIVVPSTTEVPRMPRMNQGQNCLYQGLTGVSDCMGFPLSSERWGR
ncbi:hypothetical protein D9M68_951990 [compost metagenome]